jgi:site-specific recombinase XerD
MITLEPIGFVRSSRSDLSDDNWGGVTARIELVGSLPAESLSFRVTTITDLLEHGVPLHKVQHLAGHADPLATRLYDRRQKRVSGTSSSGSPSSGT